MEAARTRRRLLFGLIVLPLAVACWDLAPTPTVTYRLDAPLCSSTLPMEFRVDSQLLGVDTFRVNLGQQPEHVTSPAFALQPGFHQLSARIVDGFAWPDTFVIAHTGLSFTRTLPLDCS